MGSINLNFDSRAKGRLPILWGVWSVKDQHFVLIHETPAPCKAWITKEVTNLYDRSTLKPNRSREEFQVLELEVRAKTLPTPDLEINDLLEKIGIDSSKIDDMTLQILRNAKK